MEGTEPSAGQRRLPNGGCPWPRTANGVQLLPPGVWPRLPGRYGCAEGALSREPPGRVFWSGGLGLWAPGTRWEATALTAWLRRSAKDRHYLSVGPHYSLPDWGWISLLPVSLQGPRKEQSTATSFKCYQDISHFPLNSPARLVLFLPLFY